MFEKKTHSLWGQKVYACLYFLNGNITETNRKNNWKVSSSLTAWSRLAVSVTFPECFRYVFLISTNEIKQNHLQPTSSPTQGVNSFEFLWWSRTQHGAKGMAVSVTFPECFRYVFVERKHGPQGDEVRKWKVRKLKVKSGHHRLPQDTISAKP